ncbi:MAG TPA: hypothetical protein VN782_11620 [Usitatibacter sp.]|nr:hypothetical protein [Usitatibacter sp.]
MATIIAGGFDVVTDADAAVERLRQAGVRTEDLCTFGVNPAGEHDRLPGGGDRRASPGAKDEGKNAGKGGAIGAAAGLAAGAATTPLLGPAGLAAGAAAGAYVGSLVGGLSGMSKEPQPGHETVRPAETLIAVNVDSGDPPADDVVRLFEECNARQIERTDGRWENGQWADFNPASAPHLIGGRDAREAANRAPPPPR